MATPPSTWNERNEHLNRIVAALSIDEILNWSPPTENDLAGFAATMCNFSEIDYRLRSLVDLLDLVGEFPRKSKGKESRLQIAQIEELLPTLSFWTDGDQAAFRDIRELRKGRNLLAHFVVRRFPTEDAFFFLTLDRADYKRVFGEAPALPGQAMYGVADASQVFEKIERISRCLSWLEQTIDGIKAGFPSTFKHRDST